MLIFCDYHNYRLIDNQVTFNLSSPVEGLERLNLLPTFNVKYDSKEFDLEYYNYVMSSNSLFYELMKIIITLYNGYNATILIGTGEVYDFIAEGLQKLIQQRYGINSYMIYDMSDYDSIIIDRSEFSLQGLYNLDLDKERFTDIMLSMHSMQDLETMTEQMNQGID